MDLIGDFSKKRASEPAGDSPAAGGQQTDKGRPQGSGPEDCIFVVNDRDRRTLAWLRTQVSEEVIIAAVEGLAGARKPFVSNVAKLLGLTIPQSLERSSKDEALRHLAAIRAELKIGSR